MLFSYYFLLFPIISDFTHICIHIHSCADKQLLYTHAYKMKTKPEMIPIGCAEIKRIRSHGGPAAVSKERVVPKVTAPDTLILSPQISSVNSLLFIQRLFLSSKNFCPFQQLTLFQSFPSFGSELTLPQSIHLHCHQVIQLSNICPLVLLPSIYLLQLLKLHVIGYHSPCSDDIG